MRRSRTVPALLCAALLAAAACSSGGDDDGTSAAAGADDTEAAGAATGEAPSAGAAVPVTMELESATASTATIGRAGGSVYATAGDGTEYALQIPPGALGEDTAITVTPLSGLGGMPDETELRFGASLEPDGLVFATPAWLFVRSDAAPDEVFSGIRIDDGKATLAGIGHDGERFVLGIGHFSGGGGAACFPTCGGPGGAWPDFPSGDFGRPGEPGGGPIDLSGGGSVPDYNEPGSVPGPFPAGDDGATSGGGSPTGHGSLTDGLDGGTATGSGSSASGGTAAELADAVQELADAQLSGDEEAEAAANEKLDKVKEKVKDEAWKAAQACVEEKDLNKLKEIIHWVTVGQLLGAAKDDAEEETLTSLIGVCYRFELDALADMTMKLGGETFVIGDSIELTVPLLFNGLGLEGAATGTVDPTGYDRGAEFLEVMGSGLAGAMGHSVANDVSQNDYFQCTTKPGTGTLDVMAVNLLTKDGPSVNIAPSIASSAIVNCQEPFTNMDVPPFVVDLSYYPETGFPGVSDAGILFEGWTVTEGGDPFATKSVHHTMSEQGAEILMAWDLTLRHAPAALPPR